MYFNFNMVQLTWSYCLVGGCRPQAPLNYAQKPLGFLFDFYYTNRWRISRLSIRIQGENANGSVFTFRLATARGITVHAQSRATGDWHTRNFPIFEDPIPQSEPVFSITYLCCTVRGQSHWIKLTLILICISYHSFIISEEPMFLSDQFPVLI